MDIEKAYQEITEALSEVMTISPAGDGRILMIKKPFRDNGGSFIRGPFFLSPDNGIYIAIDPLISLDEEGHFSNAHFKTAPLKKTTGGEVSLFDLINLAMNDADAIPLIDMERAKRAAEEISRFFEKGAHTAAAIDQPSLISIVPQKYYMPNNKLAKQMTQDIVGNGVTGLSIAGEKKKITKCILTYEGENVRLSGQKAFTEFDRNIYNGIVSLFVEGDESHLMTPAMIYRAANGITDGTDPSAGMKGAITRSVNKIRFILAEIDLTEEAKMYKADVTKFRMKDTLLNVREVSVTASGKTITAFQITRPPLLYEYAQVSKQIATFPPQLLDVREVPKDKKGNIDKKKEAGSRISNTERRMAVKLYLLRRINDMKRKDTLSRTISFDKLYAETFAESENTFTEKEKRAIKEYIPQVLDYWTHQGFISGHTTEKKGNKITGVKITF